MTSAPIRRGVILLAHGSRDPLWRKPVEAVATRSRQIDPTASVECAYLEFMEPDLPACAARMARAGVQSITVVPMFLGVGKHAREDMPRLIEVLRISHPHVAFSLQSSIGEDERVVELMARIALAGA
jgi:sirohydrochlorin cobaltochelatase